MAEPRARRFTAMHVIAPRLTATIGMLIVLLAALQLAASLFFYLAIDRQTQRDDHARRIAELLVVSDRVHGLVPGHEAKIMSSRYLAAAVADAPGISATNDDDAAAEIADKIVAWEPGLANRDLRLSVQKAEGGRSDLIGTIRLADGSWLNFRSRNAKSMWPIASRAVTVTLASAAAGLLVSLVVLHLLGRPLRQLAIAAEAIGHGRTIAIREQGSRDLRGLAHAMNAMQARIGRLLRDQATSFEAISHDLRTPLSRQKIAAEMIDDPEIAEIVAGSVEEMEALLRSLQQFLRAQHLTADAEPIDLAELVQGVARPYDGRLRVDVEGPVPVVTFVEPLRLALAALSENAVQYGDSARITLARDDRGGHEIRIEDRGPGIDPSHYEDILDPFFRLDEARSRDTAGFGLGIPTAHRLMARFDGTLLFERGKQGGLVVRLRVPEG